MSQYTVRFEWPAGAPAEESDRIDLTADTFDAAKMQAAMLYASHEFRSAPTAYQILQNGETEVYRYASVGT